MEKLCNQRTLNMNPEINDWILKGNLKYRNLEREKYRENIEIYKFIFEIITKVINTINLHNVIIILMKYMFYFKKISPKLNHRLEQGILFLSTLSKIFKQQ